MHEPDVVSALVPLGFSLNEARAYGALAQGGPSTGYEVGQRAQIPRSAVYAVLRRLVKAGAARSIAGRDGDPERFIATPADTLVALLRKRFDASAQGLEEALRRLDTTPEAPDAYSVRGYTRVMEEAERLVGTAKERLVISGWPRELALLGAELKRAAKRKVHAVVFSHATLPDDFGAQVFSYGLDETKLETFWKHRLVVVADDLRTLVGATEQGTQDNAVVSATPAIAELATSQVALDVTLLAQRQGLDVEQTMAKMLRGRVGSLDRLLDDESTAKPVAERARAGRKR
jgi:sugar-specific transcriptional regulator TrmB